MSIERERKHHQHSLNCTWSRKGKLENVGKFRIHLTIIRRICADVAEIWSSDSLGKICDVDKSDSSKWEERSDWIGFLCWSLNFTILLDWWCTSFAWWWSWIRIRWTMMHNRHCCSVAITMKINWISTYLSTISRLTFILYSLKKEKRKKTNSNFKSFSLKMINNDKSYLLWSYPFVNTKKKRKKTQVHQDEQIIQHHHVDTFFNRHAWHWFRCALSTIHIPVFAWHLKEWNLIIRFIFKGKKRNISLPIN